MGLSFRFAQRVSLLSATLAMLMTAGPVAAQTDAFVYRLPIQLRYADGSPARDQVVQVWQRQGEANGPQTDAQVAECMTGTTGQCVLEYQLAEYGDLPDLRIVGHEPADRIVGIGDVTKRWVLQGEEVLAGLSGTPLALVLDVEAADGFTRDLNPTGAQPVPVWDLMVPPAQTEAYATLAAARQAPDPTKLAAATATLLPSATARPPSPLPPSPLPPTAQPTAVAPTTGAASPLPAGALLGVALLAGLALGTFVLRGRLNAQQGNRP